MARIKILPENIARKIAAGEVIERPASVVKELCENAFDAQAKQIEVELADGGLSLIRVRDNGLGMSPEDLKVCYLPHATSKIETEEDLLRIRTWGFRGEALSSIAAVSELTITSREKEALIGARIKIKFGKEVSFVEKGLAPGTIVEVVNLFANVPARRAFLKSPRAETARVNEIVKLMALENPQTNLSLKTKGKILFEYNYKLGRLGLLAEFSGLKAENFLTEEVEVRDIRLTIILSKSEHFFPTARYLYFLVNNRVVKDKLISAAAFEGLKSVYPKGRYPALLLALTLPPEQVDVNVHPAKWEVRFREERRLFELIKKSLENLFKPTVSFEIKTKIEEDLPISYDRKTTSEEDIWSTSKVAEPAENIFKKPSTLFSKNTSYQVLSRFGKEFFLILADDELYIFDYHAAHERLLFEQWKKELKDNLKIQALLVPQVFSLTGKSLERVEILLPVLNSLGFEIDFFGEEKIILRSVPALLGDFSREVLEKFLAEELSFSAENLLEEVMARISCKAARKAGEKLSFEEVLNLFIEVKNTGLSNCPHGRPLYWRIGLDEVRRKLGRKI
ncbi:DNA mismatch repair protein MutL [Thermodesulfatator indicus DSM 15286]|uniref:DNA mismatch repair protein MutL n=1 Tax=Thermodesulfatator indicus (strain DSM 15286 / JCM 11887 / CIR29812) TaxID=667014 RepID=F8AA87_THEID|nr:DNA mismatch repair endonuclease MutL [Thermodesulfatator indicus]AEH44223.1 DNA mismatch repair protein MutL [Thermodesulfatator indicus DSM 15286]